MTRFERWSVLGSTGATAVTGGVYLWMKYFVEPPDPWAVVNHPWQPGVLKAHILVAPLMVFAVGMIALRHVWAHYRSGTRVGRRTGITTAFALAPMVMTGYLIQAITAEGALRNTALLHIGFGIAFTLGLALHFPIAQRRRRRPPPESFRQTRRLRIPTDRVHTHRSI